MTTQSKNQAYELIKQGAVIKTATWEDYDEGWGQLGNGENAYIDLDGQRTMYGEYDEWFNDLQYLREHLSEFPGVVEIQLWGTGSNYDYEYRLSSGEGALA